MIRKTIALRGRSIVCKEAGHKSKIKARSRKTPTPLLSRSFHPSLSSSSRSLVRALNAASALHGWWVMARNASSKKLPVSAKLSAACTKGHGEKLECISALCHDSIHTQRSTQSLIEWNVMETSMEDGLLGRAALSRNEISGCKWVNHSKKKHNAESFHWSAEATRQGWTRDPARRCGHVWRNESDHPWKDSKQAAGKDLHPQLSRHTSSTSKTSVDLDELEDGDQELEALAGCAETRNLNLGMMGSGGHFSRRLRNREKRNGCFPPPLSSLMGKGCCYLSQQQMPSVLLQPSRSNGRFVLRQVKVAPQIHFQPIRTDNRLILHLINPEKTDQPLSRQPNFEEYRKKELFLRKNATLDRDAPWIIEISSHKCRSLSECSKDASVMVDPERKIQKEELAQEQNYRENISAQEIALKNSEILVPDEEKRCGKVEATRPMETSCSDPNNAEIAGIDLLAKGKSSVGFDVHGAIPSHGGFQSSIDSQRRHIVFSFSQNESTMLEDGVSDLHSSAKSFLHVSLSKAVSGLEALPQSRCKRFDLFEEDSVLPIWERQCIASS